jgi:hypothetical protein
MYNKQTAVDYDMTGQEDTQFNLFILFIEAALDGVVWEHRSQERGVEWVRRPSSVQCQVRCWWYQTPVGDTVRLEFSAWAVQLAYSGVQK